MGCDLMGTWASFYVRNGDEIEFIGGVNADGYPRSLRFRSGIPRTISYSRTETLYRHHVANHLAKSDRDCVVMRKPWVGIDISDFVYCFMDGEVFLRSGLDTHFIPARIKLKLIREGKDVYDSFTKNIAGTGLRAVPILR